MTASSAPRRRDARGTTGAALVRRWTDYYTRDLDTEVATDRREEIASDLWEQESAGHASRMATSAAILWRAVRGVPADLSWRRQKADGAPASTASGGRWRWSQAGSTIVAALVAAALTGFGITALVRIALAITRHEFLPRDATMLSTALGTLALICGIVLLLRPRTRWLGALWMAAGSVPVLWFGTVTLITLSSLTQRIYYAILSYRFSWAVWTQWASWGVVAAIALFFIALAIAWFPPSSTRAAR